MAGYGASSTWALVPNRLSGMVSLQRSIPSLLFRLYGSESDYTQMPWSENGVGKLQWRYSPTTRRRRGSELRHPFGEGLPCS